MIESLVLIAIFFVLILILSAILFPRFTKAVIIIFLFGSAYLVATALDRFDEIRRGATRNERQEPNVADLSQWNVQVRAAVFKNHPENIEGTATITFTVSGDGQIVFVNPEGEEPMRSAAAEAVREARVPPPPDRRAHTFSIKFRG